VIPSASQIMARRWWARLCVRAVALAAVLWSCIAGLGTGLGGGSDVSAVLNSMFQLSGQQLSLTPLLVGMALHMLAPLATAATLIAFERRIVRWLVPIPTHRCPRCDYSLIGVHEPRCPECALPLDEALVGPDALPVLEDHVPATPGSGSAGRRRETPRRDPE
jgi:hypothetical protein